ncbi:chloride channel protein [Catenovulum sp. 2E275]|uniref:chloride channel protein n=1 Tax=Catenovulum sp. 2E275 TaxID=2980497 RepID=UPI0021CEEDEB|nr:chloride channel protein [Catenovulum sp. 2E275]MCU4676046.1 chloride channel protein [Catenovulum sp. 2E275]
MPIEKHLKRLRTQLAYPKISIQLSILGLIAGLCASAFIIAFRWCLDNIQLFYLDTPDDFTSLEPHFRFILPFIGAGLIALVGVSTQFKYFRLGIPFVIYRLKIFYGMMPLRNTINQFFGGIIAMSSGFSVGREGPAVHLGAGAASYFASWLKLPYNSVRTLSACGMAAAIAASFNTPLAAVIFVMEVVLREYKTHIFVPVMLASVAGAWANRLVFGHDHDLSGLSIHLLSIEHYPYLVFMGLIVGCFAFAFNRQLLEIIRSFRSVNMLPRLFLSALITAIIGFLVPQALGTGLGAIYIAQVNIDNAQLLMTIFIAKAALTIFAIGLGVPGGVIGPILGLGAMLGTLLALVASIFIGNLANYSDIYGILGLAALMAACLNAPLAALVTALEMTYNPEIIAPAMVVIVSAYVISNQLFKNRSLFIMQLELQKLDYQVPPTYDILQKTGVQAAMERNFVLVKSEDEEVIKRALNRAGKRPVILKQTEDDSVSFKLVSYDVSLDPNNKTPYKFEELQGVESRYTLAEPYEILQQKRRGSVYIFEQELDKIIGVLSWHQLRLRLTKGNYQEFE